MKDILKKVGRGVLAGLTSTEAVKAEKSIATLVITRVVISLGGSAITIETILKIAGLN